MFEAVLSEAELWVGEMRGVEHRGARLLVVRHERGVSVYPDRCPHQGYPLSHGDLNDGVITCALHRHQFDAQSGDGINPLRPCLASLPCKVEAGQVLVELTLEVGAR